jgi:hypothetical protein
MVSGGEVMEKMVYHMKLIVCLTAATFIAGCISAREKHALSELVPGLKKHVIQLQKMIVPLLLIYRN